MPSKSPDGASRGWIVPIGGAENKENDRHILDRFVRVSGGTDANIVIIPTASRVYETGARYEKIFKDIGAADVATMDFDTRRDCQEPGRLRRLEEATGIFFTGGNQLRLTTLLGGTAVREVRLTRKEFDLLQYLAASPNTPISHRRLLQAVWGPDYGNEVVYLRVFINQLRKKIEPEPAKPRYILTEPCIGYQFHMPAEIKTES